MFNIKYLGHKVMEDTHKAIGLSLIGIVGLVVFWVLFGP